MAKKKQNTPPLKLYTKTGDKGESNVLAGIRLPKDHMIFEVLGTMDELNAVLGVVVTQSHLQQSALPVKLTSKIRLEIVAIQDTLLNLGAIVAGSEKIDTSVADIKQLEKRIDFYQKNTRDDWYHTFLLPGGVGLAAYTDLARTVCRRLERRMATLNQDTDVRLYVKPESLRDIQAYINRLSDYLFALRCYVNSEAGYEEKEYSPKYLETLK